MIGTKNIHLSDYSSDESTVGSYSTTEKAVKGSDISPDGRSSADILLERMQQHTAFLEELILCKNNEINELKRVLALRTEEMKQKQVEYEHVMIHPARYSAMGEMLGTIAHHWRQPLNVISLTVQNMKDAWDYGEFNAELLDRSVFKTMEQVMLLSRTIDDFRTFLNPVETSEIFNPVQCIKECVGLLSGWFSNFPSIEVRNTEGVGEDIRITGCQNVFKQVILNVLNNANDAIQGQQRRIGPTFRGMVTIDIRCRDYYSFIVISDNGGGIAESSMDHIFEPYFTTKDKANGIGIGLYVSKLIIENSMNGSLWAENIPDGALFGIKLPLALDEEVSL